MEGELKVFLDFDEPAFEIVDFALELVVCPGGLSKPIGRRVVGQIDLAQVLIIHGQFGIREDLLPEAVLCL